MFLNLGGGTKLKAEQTDQVVAPALKLLAAFSDPESTRKAIEEMVRVRDQALEYAGQEKVLRQAHDTLAKAEKTLADAQAQADHIKANAEHEAAVLGDRIRALKAQAANAHAEFERVKAETEKLVDAANQEAADAKAEAMRLTTDAENIRAAADRDREKAGELRRQWEAKVAQLKAMVTGD